MHKHIGPHQQLQALKMNIIILNLNFLEGILRHSLAVMISSTCVFIKHIAEALPELDSIICTPQLQDMIVLSEN